MAKQNKENKADLIESCIRDLFVLIDVDPNPKNIKAMKGYLKLFKIGDALKAIKL